MIICKVIGNVWATRKEESLNGLKLMIVRRVELCKGRDQESFVAAEFVGAGIGEKVLVATGSSARMGDEGSSAPIDASIVGIIDEVE